MNRINDKSHVEDYQQTSRELLASIDFGRIGVATHTPDSRSVRVITDCGVIPPQWRFEALRTILPDDLSIQLEKWRCWVDDVRAGRVREFLARCYLHEMAMECFGVWRELRRGVEVVERLSATWAKKPILVEICDQIRQVPAPTLIPAPIDYWHRDANGASSDSIARALQEMEQQCRSYLALVRRWNRNSKRQGTGHWNLLDFQAFLNQADIAALEEFLSWAGVWSSRGYGLFLDY